MTKKALAFLVRKTTINGYELACDRCSVVLQINHDHTDPFPKHRCVGEVSAFNIVLELDSLVSYETRIDHFWNLS